MRYTDYHSTEFFSDSEEPFYINRVYETTRDECRYHTHDFVEICYVASGKGYHLIDGHEYSVSRGDLFIINFDVRHTFIRDENTEELTTYNLVFKPFFFDVVLRDIKDLEFDKLPNSFLFHDIYPTENVKRNLSLDPDDQRVFDNLLKQLLKEYTLKPHGYLSITRAYMVQLIILITRKLYEENLKQDSSNTHDIKNIIIDNIIDYLQKNFSEKINLNDLMIKSFFSKGYLCRVFKSATSMTISEYTQILRVNEACILIEKTDTNITDIAYKVGFSDYKSFYKTFIRITGKKPNEYRNR